MTGRRGDGKRAESEEKNTESVKKIVENGSTKEGSVFFYLLRVTACLTATVSQESKRGQGSTSVVNQVYLVIGNR